MLETQSLPTMHALFSINVSDNDQADSANSEIVFSFMSIHHLSPVEMMHTDMHSVQLQYVRRFCGIQKYG